MRQRMLKIGDEILDIIESRIRQLRDDPELDIKKIHVLAIIFGIVYDKLMAAGGLDRRSPKLEMQKLVDATKRQEVLKLLAEGKLRIE